MFEQDRYQEDMRSRAITRDLSSAINYLTYGHRDRETRRKRREPRKESRAGSHYRFVLEIEHATVEKSGAAQLDGHVGVAGRVLEARRSLRQIDGHVGHARLVVGVTLARVQVVVRLRLRERHVDRRPALERRLFGVLVRFPDRSDRRS